MWYVPTIEYSSALKKKGILTHATTCMNLVNILPSKINLPGKDKYWLILLKWSPRVVIIIETEGRIVITRNWERRKGGCCWMGRISVLPEEKVLVCLHKKRMYLTWLKSESRSVMSDSQLSHGLYRPDSPGQNTGVGSYSLPRESSQPRDWTQVSCIEGIFFTSWAIREALRDWSTHLKWLN